MRSVKDKVRGEIRGLISDFVYRWNKGRIREACTSYTQDAVLILTEQGERIAGKNAIIDAYLRYFDSESTAKLAIEVVDVFTYDTDENEPPQMAAATLRWSFTEGGTELASGYALEVYIRDEYGNFKSVADAS